MKAFRMLVLALLLTSCNVLKPVNELRPEKKIEVKRQTKYVMFRVPNFDTLKKLDSLKNENHLLRVEIDYLKEKLKKLETLHKIKNQVDSLAKTIKE